MQPRHGGRASQGHQKSARRRAAEHRVGVRTLKTIDLNCDMGESYGAWKIGEDAAVMPYITSANIACGFHGGDPATIRETVALAVERGVAIGAHPSPPHLQGVGRRARQV